MAELRSFREMAEKIKADPVLSDILIGYLTMIQPLAKILERPNPDDNLLGRLYTILFAMYVLLYRATGSTLEESGQLAEQHTKNEFASVWYYC